MFQNADGFLEASGALWHRQSVQNLFFFKGENQYALSKEVLRWKQNFIAKHGIENFLLLSGKGTSLSDLLDAVETMPFIAEKRLVVLEGVPKIQKEEFQRFKEGIHPQTVVVIADAKPDKRLTVVKEIEKASEVKEFPLLSSLDLLHWLKDEAMKEGATLADAAAKVLVDIVGDDQWMLESELKKLVLFSGGSISVQDIELLAVPSGTQVLWRLTDLLGGKQPIEALKFFRRRIERGEDPYGMWSVLLNLMKNLALVVAALDAGIKTERTIADETHLHFFAVRGVLPLARSLPIARLKELIDWAAEADIQLKTGGHHYSAEHPEEVVALAERLMLACV